MKPNARRKYGKDYYTPRPLTEQDKFQQAATTAAKDGVVAQLKRFIETNRDRAIRSLNDKELECVALGAINAWCLKRAEQEIAERELNDSVADVYA